MDRIHCADLFEKQTATVNYSKIKSTLNPSLIVTLRELYEKSSVGSCKDTMINESYIIMYKLWKTKERHYRLLEKTIGTR